ncbi:sigma-70 family RNA polymerase sigma factor [Marinobacter sp.]|uniref:sigma-70 family RNA polymerase sigma factor n=1 Tax=Marinobacter sp. TaxID=50741 RepID=UPI0034A255A0
MVTSTQTRNRTGAVRRKVFEQETHRLMDRLYGTALRLSRNPDDAEDIVAETVATAWSKLEQLTDVAHIEGWLFRILNRTFIDQWRRRQCRQDKEVALQTDENEPAFSLFEKLHQPFLLWWGAPEQAFLNQLLKEDIQQAMDQLPDDFRVVMVLVEIEGNSYHEAAELLDIPMGTVRSRLSRARALLQQTLWTQGLDAGLTSTVPEHTGPLNGGAK